MYRFLVEIGRGPTLGDRIVASLEQGELAKLEALRQRFGSRVPIHLFYDIGKLGPLTEDDVNAVEEDFFDGEKQVKYNIEWTQQRDGTWRLRIKRSHYRRLYATLRGVDYPLVLAADYPEGRSDIVCFSY